MYSEGAEVFPADWGMQRGEHGLAGGEVREGAEKRAAFLWVCVLTHHFPAGRAAFACLIKNSSSFSDSKNSAISSCPFPVTMTSSPGPPSFR
jgi:hypothetical protein